MTNTTQLQKKISKDPQLLYQTILDFLTMETRSIRNPNQKKCFQELLALHQKKNLSKPIQETLLHFHLQRTL